ncbi:unnamed protein product [Sympodiomycopsis kandeliae]
MAGNDVRDSSAAAKDTAAAAAANGGTSPSHQDATKDKDASTTSTTTTTPPSSAGPSSALTMSAVLDFLKARGYQQVEAAIKAEMKAGSSSASQQARTISLDELASKSAPRDALATSAANQQDNSPSSPAQQSLEVLAAEALKIDKTDRIRGFGMVRNWCQGGLDVYQTELQPLLLPLFVHAYLDLIEMGAESAAFSLYAIHSSALLPQHLSLLSHIRSIVLPAHMTSDELVQRFRTERFVLKMSQTVFGLLLGWLTDGTGPVASAGAAPGVGGSEPEAPATRGRLAMLRIINERCRIQVLQAKPYELTPELLEEGTGLTGAGPSYSSQGIASRAYPALLHNAVSQGGDAIAEFNAKNAGPQLKLGPEFPLNDRLKEEVQREVDEELRLEQQERDKQKAQEQASQQQQQQQQPDDNSTPAIEPSQEDQPTATTAQDGEEPMEGVEKSADTKSEVAGDEERRTDRKTGTASVAPTTAKDTTSSSSIGKDLLQPTLSDLPPQPPLFRTVDIMREVSRIRDARKALRIGLPTSAIATDHSHPRRHAALPSICTYTYHDVEDGLTCSTFSDDLSLMAAGFEESYVQLWSLKGEPLRALKSDVRLSEIRDSNTLRSEEREQGYSLATRKLIGHSGPVYGVSFDPLGGSACSPRTLLSCSADSTVRLWSMDTYSALVSYRGHTGPAWDVEYGPNGTYFATAGMDKTARLWNTERINPLRMYVGHLSDVESLSFHPNSLYLATGSNDRTIRLWDIQRGCCVRLFVGNSSGSINKVKISPNGHILASASQDTSTSSSISIWDLGSGKRIKKMKGHKDLITSMDFSNDGGMLFSTSKDCTLRSWDLTLATSNEGEEEVTKDCVSTIRTKKTPLLDVKMTRRNLCLSAGAFLNDWEPM